MELGEEYLFTQRCILCRSKYDQSADFKNIKTTTVHSSKKSVKDVLTHIAKCIKGQVIIPDTAYACGLCYEKLTEYDQIMLQLLTHQRELAQLLETSINTVDYDDDEYFDQLSIKEEVNSEISIGGGGSESEGDGECDNIEDDGDEDYKLDGEKKSKRTKGARCEICEKQVSSKFALKVHMETHTNAKRCPICGVLRRDEEYLELHMNVHEGKSENECRYCPKRYSRRSNVIRHMHLHWDKKKFQCEKCGLRFSQANLLYNHKMHHEAEEQPLVCPKCEQVFKSKKTFRHHMVTHREDRPMYPCEVCGKKFTERYTLKMHLKTHASQSDDEEKSVKKREVNVRRKVQIEFPCIICNLVLSNKDILERHMAEEHDVISNV